MTEETIYTSSRLTKGTISLDEIQTLLTAWQPGEPSLDFAQRVQTSQVLTKQTSQRMRDVVDLFRYWFLTPDETPARNLKRYLETGGDRRVLSELVFLYKARSESVLYDYTGQRYWPAAHDGALYLRTDDIEDFFREAQEKGYIADGWSANTSTRTAQGILRALYEVDFLQEGRGNSREFTSFQPSDYVVTYLAHDLHFMGLADGQVADHTDWLLFGMTREGVLRRLDGLDRRSGLLVQWAGSVVSITWTHETMDEVIHALEA